MRGHVTGAILKQLIDIPEDPAKCWNWIGRVSPTTGYGKKQLDGKTLLAHRWVYSIFKGVIPEGLVIDHLCSNRRCVNPHHLEVVNQSTNCRRGAGTKLTIKDVREIRFLISEDKTEYKKIAEMFKVSNVTISDIKSGKSWTDLD